MRVVVSGCAILTVLALVGCEEGREAHRLREEARRVTPVDPGLPPEELAIELRRRADPEPLEGAALRRFDVRELLGPSEPVREPQRGGIRGALTGFATTADRSALPEFAAAKRPEGRSIREHLDNAILMNTSRMGYYADRAGPLRGRSLLLSRYMVVGEAMSLPNAGRWDRKAEELRAAGLPPLHEDLVPLLPLPRETPPTWRGVATAAQRKQVKELTEALQEDLRAALERKDLGGVADLCHAAIEQLMAWERAWGMHWQMTRHTIGSIGLAALRGSEHAANADRLELSIEYLRGLVRHTIGYGRDVDRLAQPLHARGVGIVVNEFTDQPFLQAHALRGEALPD